MKQSPLEGKTVRPGFAAYSFYYRSDRRPVSRAAAPQPAKAPAKPKTARATGGRGFLVAGLLALLLVAGFVGFRSAGDNNPDSNPAAVASIAEPAKNHCASNPDAKHIVVSVSERHLWACAGSKSVYSSAVITGMVGHAETETPLGTYKIYAKQTNTTLTGSDSRGTWRDPVYYWMPFLDNQYGTYGFHDATWRKNNAFGHVDSHSNDASHGCVELPLGTSKWLYEWSTVGTPVTVNS